jgi:PAS domain S-box-containing protein
MHILSTVSSGAAFLLAGLPVVGLAFKARRKDGKSDGIAAASDALIEASFDGILLLTPDGQIQEVDEDFIELLGFSAEELQDRAFASIADPSETEIVQRHLSQASESTQVFEVQITDAKEAMRILRVSIVLLDGDAGQLVVGVSDVSEGEQLRKRLAFTEKINLLSRLMSGIGTDIRNTIDTLGPLVEIAGDDSASDTIKRLTELHSRISFFPIQGIRGACDTAVDEVVDRAIETVSSDPAAIIEHARDDSVGSIPAVLADSDQLQEAFKQVLRNAVEAATITRGAVDVTTQPASIQQATRRRDFILPAGEYAQITISDTGPGIPQAALAHVFDPLFTTSGGSPLAGLGMAVTYGIIKNHRGYIDIESTEGVGTTVDIFLPQSRIAAAEAAASIDDLEEEVQEADESVPAVEDEAAEVEELTAEEPAEVEVEKEAEITEGAAEEVTITAEELLAEAEAERGVEVDILEESAEADDEVAAEVEAPAEEEPPVAEEEEAEAEETEVEEEEVTEEEIEVPVKDEHINEAEIAQLSGHETILIIEEEADCRSAYMDTLSTFGYNILPARNWVEGVNLIDGHSQLVDLVLVNLLVPEMVWVKTVIDLQRAAVALRIGMMGGSTKSDTVKRYLDIDGISYLEKPFSTASLLRGVREALDAELEE